MPDIPSRLRGGIYGLLIGDALGVPYEFHGPESIPPLEQIEFVPPKGFRRAHGSVKPGTWSDDGAQALCLLASLLDCNAFDPEDFGQRLVRWHNDGYLAVDNYVFDLGITTASAIRQLCAGTPALQAGPANERDNGNGSLMRVLPLALWHRGPDAELVELAHQQSRVTHGHTRSQVACAVYCLWARGILNNVAAPWSQAIAALEALYRSEERQAGNLPYLRELKQHFGGEESPKVRGTGYVVDALWSARHATNQGSYENVVRAAIALGNDTDTTACIAGGIAGLRDGIEAIPQRWRDALRGQELVQPLVKGLLAREVTK